MLCAICFPPVSISVMCAIMKRTTKRGNLSEMKMLLFFLSGCSQRRIQEGGGGGNGGNLPPFCKRGYVFQSVMIYKYVQSCNITTVWYNNAAELPKGQSLECTFGKI